MPTSSILVVVLLVGTVQPTAGAPSTPAHGVDAETFATLWSGDRDTDAAESVPTTDDAAAVAELASVTDISFTEPPTAVERWNRGDHTEFPESDRHTSISPAGASLTDGVFIRDAYAAIVAVQPSTKLWLSESEQPQYVDSDGEVLGTVDYRVVLPDDDDTGSRRVYWDLLDEQITEIQLLVDGQAVATADGTQTPTLQFRNLHEHTGDQHTLTLEATIDLELSKRVISETGSCEPIVTAPPASTPTAPQNETQSGNEATPPSTASETCRTIVSRLTSTPTERITVRDSVDVVAYDPSFTGTLARYPDGTQGIAISGSHPWQGYSRGETTVRGLWRYYSARDPHWDELTVSTAQGVTTRSSPVRPLQVYAYPSRIGTDVDGNTLVLTVDGSAHEAPSLPTHIDVDVVEDAFIESETIIAQTSDQSSALTISGLVRGTTYELDSRTLEVTTVRPSSLSLAILEADGGTVEVQASLTNAETGEPIHTADQAGVLRIGDRTVETGRDGTATVSLSRPAGALTARYDPGAWWETEDAYLGSTDTVYVRGTTIPVLPTLFALSIPIGSLLGAAFLIDRATGLSLWPPWRGL